MLERVRDGSEMTEKPMPSGDDRFFVELNELREFLRFNRRAILGSTLFGIMLALAYLLFAETRYTAYAQVLIDAKSQQVLREQWTEAGIILDNAQVESQIAVLRSEQIAKAVIEKAKLHEDVEFGGKVSTTTPGSEKPAPLPPDQLRRVFDAYLEGMDIRRLGLSYVIEIGYSARTPEKAANLSNTIAEAYLQDQLTTRGQAARQGSIWLEERIDQLRLQMNEAAFRLQEFKVKRDYRITGRREPATSETADKADPPVAAKPGTLDELESTALTYRKIYESYLQAYTESVLRQSYPGSNARIISPAARPSQRSSPKILRSLAAGSIVGLLLGLGMALLRHSVRRSA